MIDLFDLSAGASTKIVTRDGSPVRRSESDRKEFIDLKTVTDNMRRSSSGKKSGGMPMKMLIAQEMAKEGETNQKSTSVIAKLMGLDDDLPLPKPVTPSNRRRLTDGHISVRLDRDNSQVPFEKHTNLGENVEYKDVYEVGYQPPRSEHLSNESSRRGRPQEDHDKRRMDLVRQKFVEAKRLASDENLLHSKEFHDALEVLNSNKDLFLKFLEEPNSFFAKQSAEFHSAPTSPQRRCITVLKPSKSVEMKSENVIKRQPNQTAHGSRTERINRHRESNAGPAKAERFPLHTRIVVLKPSSAITSVEQFGQNDHDSLDDSEAAVRSGRLNDEKNWSVHDMYHQHDDSLQGCTQSNVFNREGSYLSRSCYEYVEEEGSSFSDSEIETPTSRHSWDYIYRFSNPYFGSSISHVSCSPESLVAREAKKHTSERWALASSNEISREKVLVRRSLSTLGEMLAMPDAKKEEVADRVAADASNQSCSNGPRIVVPSNYSVKDGERESTPRKISRSKSVPVSSSVFDNLHLDDGCSYLQHKEPEVPKEKVKLKNGKSSLKGKISNFFSSKRKKVGKEKLSASPIGALNAGAPSASNGAIVNSDVSHPVCTILEDVVTRGNVEERFENASTAVPINEPEPPSSSKAPISLEKALSFEIQNSHFGQPSPTSVLDAPFEDSNEKSPSSSESTSTTKQEPLSRSLPIGSIARTLSGDYSPQEVQFPNTKAYSDEQQRCQLIEKVLTSAGFCNQKINDIFVKWHSLDCPLDPAVLDKFLERKVEDAKCRERRSNQRLLIDSANAALQEIGQSKLWGAYPCTEPHVSAQRVATCEVLVTDEVWRLVKSWFLNDEKYMVNEGDKTGLVVNWVVGREIEGKGWSKSLRLEIDEISREICGEVLSELVEEAFSGFAVGRH